MDDITGLADSEIRAGLRNETERLKDARDNRRFADEAFEEYPTRQEHTRHARIDYRRTSSIMKRVIQVLTANLYKANPTRQLSASPEATAWLERAYARNAMLPKWQEVDRLTHIGDLAAFQFAGDVDPDVPVRIHVWGADQLVWWLDPEDQTRVLGVATLDAFDNQRRLTLWTAEEKRVYLTSKSQGPTQTAGGTAYRLADAIANPYRDEDGAGVLPFSFAHYKFPATDFHQPGPGNALRRLNDYVNFDIDEVADAKRYMARPIGIASGVAPTWAPPAQIRPGMFLNLSDGGAPDAMGNGPEGSLSYLESSPGWIGESWDDLNRYIDHSLECHGVPPGTIRMSADAASGIALMAEQAPILARAESRRVPFAFYEADAARTCLRVAAAHLRESGADARLLDVALDDLSLSLRWPPLYVLLPGAERDASDEWRVQMGIASRIGLLMEREDLTRDQAVERLRQIAADAALATALGIAPAPAGAPPVQPETTADLDPGA
ncbi:MAG TPA: hypothetical protein VGH33_03570 [Isosphaeraceae bacterium]